jgi:D-galactarolactone cycloisomerase
MKVESVVPFPISIEPKEVLRAGTFSYSSYQTVLVKVVADGVEGWGEAMTRFDPGATALIVRHIAKWLAGHDFEGPRDAWRLAWQELRVRGHTRGTDVEALSGIDIALYDCLGRTLRKPACRLFAEVTEDQVPAFAGSLFASRGKLGDQVEVARGKGLIGAKVKVGFGVEEDRRILSSVRRAWPEGMLVADANGAYGAAEAVRACSAFHGLGLSWFEEPVLPDDLEGYEQLKGSGVKIGAGESWFAGDFDRPMVDGLVSVIEPSVSRCGGLGTEVEVAAKALSRGLGFSPMTGMNSAVSLAASLHAASVHKSIGVEYNPFPNPLQTELASGLPVPKGGKVRVPTGDGLGIVIDEQFVKAHSS